MDGVWGTVNYLAAGSPRNRLYVAPGDQRATAALDGACTGEVLNSATNPPTARTPVSRSSSALSPTSADLAGRVTQRTLPFCQVHKVVK
jgi:hypothetical protein